MSNTTTAQQQQIQLQSFINHNAPNLQPDIIPMGLNDQNLTKLFTLEKNNNTNNEQQNNSNNANNEEALSYLIRKYVPSNKKCTVTNCGQSINSENPHFVTVHQIDFVKNVYSIQKAHYMCEMCYQCNDLNGFLNQMTNEGESEKQSGTVGRGELVNHFARVNGLKTVHAVQEVYNVAYALRTTASYLPLTLSLPKANTASELLEQLIVVKTPNK